MDCSHSIQSEPTHRHGYPTPPHSPESDSPSSSTASPDRNKSATLATATSTVQGFDPLEGYAKPSAQSSPAEKEANATRTSASPPAAPLPSALTPNPQARRPSTSSQARPRRASRREEEDVHPLLRPPRKADRKWTDRDKRRAKMEPPKDHELGETEEEWQKHHDEEKTSGWHHLPLVLVALPILGATVHGRAENWSDGIILILICFYLYQLIKVPWELYYASRARIVLPSSIATDEEEDNASSLPAAAPAPGSPSLLNPSDPLTPTTSTQASSRAASASALRRNELFALSLTLLVPFLGALLLYHARGLLSDPDRYINKMLIGVFIVASGVRPWLRVVRLVKRNSLYHQSLVHYPSTEVHQLKKRVETLEGDLVQVPCSRSSGQAQSTERTDAPNNPLSRAFATKSDMRLLRDGLDQPLTTLSRAVRKFARQEEFSRLSSEERFSALLSTLENLQTKQAEQEEELERVGRRMEMEEVGVKKVLLAGARQVLWHVAGDVQEDTDEEREERRKWYERGIAWYAFWPVNVPKAAVRWGVDVAVGVVGLPEEASKRERKGGVGRLAGPNGRARGVGRVEGPPVEGLGSGM
ncbi:hypothetical protein JCM11641_005680 [Rhodosporidiobolus odoratus]